MTALPSPSVIRSPTPAVPLAYADAATHEKFPPMIRIGGVLAFIGLSTTALMVPIWQRGGNYGSTYFAVATHLVPALQLTCFASGMTLIICGRVIAGRRPRAWFLLPIVMHILLVTVAVGQIISLAQRSDNNLVVRSLKSIVRALV